MEASPTQTKVCTKCKCEKSTKSFYSAKGGLHGVTGRCRTCILEANALRNTDKPAPRYHSSQRCRLKAKYGLTFEGYVALLTTYASGCAVCGIHLTESRLCVDHCHDTGEIRGILCYKCNLAAGHLRENPDNARRLLNYLEIHNGDRNTERSRQTEEPNRTEDRNGSTGRTGLSPT